MDLKTEEAFVSRDVHFHEPVFPFAKRSHLHPICQLNENSSIDHSLPNFYEPLSPIGPPTNTSR